MPARPIDAVLGHAGDGAIGRTACTVGRPDLDDAADAGILDAGRIDTGDMMRAPVDPIDHQRQVLAQLVRQMLVDDAADDRRHWRGIVNLEAHRIALGAFGPERLLHRADDVATLAHLAQGRLQPLAQFPDARRVFGREAHVAELAETAQPHGPV
jgi:hypothetical protein